MDQRAVFFLGAGAVSLLTTLVTPEQFRWLSVGLAGVYVVLALLSALDHRGRS